MESIISSISPDTLLVVERDRTISICNTSVKRIFGYAPDEMIGQKTDLLYFDRRTNKDLRPREIYEALQRDGFHIGMATGRRKSGETFPLEIISAEISGRGGAVLLLRDLTERAQAEEKRRELESRIQRRQRLESLGVLAGGVAHDFNNLLTVILGNCELSLMQLPPDPEARQNIEAVIKAARQAGSLCGQMMAYSGKGSLVSRSLDLSEVVNDTVKMLEISVGKKGRIEYQLEKFLPKIDGDIVQIQQLVMNLVINAGDALGENGVIAISTGMMHCDESYLGGCVIDADQAAGQFVYLKVRDNGCGMDDETKARIFEPFFSTKKEGRGLGLASVLGIMRGHRGALHVESARGHGSAFTVCFPLGGRA
jgi:PAS domain S-box-containing protein